jgi:nicotinate-nucleotide adenylyltransferase
VRLGLFGGTFDPPHNGHLLVACDAAIALRLDRVVFVPAAQPPHKQQAEVTDAAIRARMLRLALEGEPRFCFDTLELDRPGPSYTIDTLRELRSGRGGDWTVLMGADQFAEFDSWREPEEILRMATVGVIQRGEPIRIDSPATALPAGAGVPFAHEISPGVLQVRVTRIDVSSTMIRARIAAGVSIRYLVPPAIEAMIAELGLYRRNGASATG